MKITKTIEVEVCDFCKKLEAPADYKCTGCGRICCEDCDALRKYRHSIHFSGTYDGYYCADCEKRLTETKSDPLFNAYLALQKFITHSVTVRQELEATAQKLEEEIERHLPNATADI